MAAHTILWLYIATSLVKYSQCVNDTIVAIAASTACGSPCESRYDSEYLSCSFSNCTEVPFQYMTFNLTMVLNIHLDNNRIQTLPQLPSMPLVNYIDLTNNLLTLLRDHTFHTCPHLDILNLTNNFINTIQDSAFSGLGRLRYLLLGENSLRVIDSMPFLPCPRLEGLNLSHNSIRSIAASSMSLWHLKRLYLESNQLERLEGYWGLSEVQHVYLGHNQLQDIEDEFFRRCEKLQELRLNGNRLTNLTSEAFDGLVSLERLYLEDNLLTVLPTNMLFSMQHLQAVYLDGNPVVELKPHAFNQDIMYVSLARTNTISVLKNGSLAGLRQLTKLFLNSNRYLSTIEAGAFGGRESAIQTLDLSHNALTTLSPVLLDYHQLVRLDLTGNHWDCDCHLAWMGRTKIANQNISARCSTPHHLQGTPVHQVAFELFSCAFMSRYRYSLGVALVTTTTFLFVVLVGYLVHRYRYRVLPCAYSSGRQYRALYSAPTTRLDDPALSLRWGGHGSHRHKDPLLHPDMAPPPYDVTGSVRRGPHPRVTSQGQSGMAPTPV